MAKTETHIPKLRFVSFADPWNRCVINDFIHLRSETDSQENYSIDIELENLVSNLGIVVGDTTVRTQTNSIFKNGDILFGRLRPYLNKWWLANTNGVKSGEIWALYPKNNESNKFIYSLVQTPKFLTCVNLTSGTKMPRADWSVVKEQSFDIPNDIEQIKIGDFFQKIDQVIELQQKALETAQDYKKSMLQKMFPQKGEKVPKVRFDGFSGDWEETQLGKVAEISRGLTYKPENIVKPEQGIRVLRSSNINEDVLVIGLDDVFVDANAVKLENIQIGDILITAANGSSRLVGKHAVITRKLEKTVHGGFMLTARTDVPFFINSWMNTTEYKVMLQLVQGGNGAIGNLSKPTLEKCKMHIPKEKKEQQKIGAFFQKLDQQIEQHEKKLESYQSLKKAMLQRMFV